jgi:hypothetical protein
VHATSQDLRHDISAKPSASSQRLLGVFRGLLGVFGALSLVCGCHNEYNTPGLSRITDYQANSPFIRKTRGFMYVVGVSHPVVVGT